MSICREKGTHARPVHLNRGRHGHIWLCLECGKQLAGPKLPEEEIKALGEFFTYATEKAAQDERAKQTQEVKGEMDMKLEIGVIAGAESKQFLVDLTKQIDRLEKLSGGKSLNEKALASAQADDEDEADAPEAADAEDEDDGFQAKPAKKKTALDEEEEDEAPAPAPKKKAKKITLDDVNDACKARAKAGGKKGRAEVLAILKKKFKTETISDISDDKYQAVIDAMEE